MPSSWGRAVKGFDDCVVLQPNHVAFFAAPLKILLEQMGAACVGTTGVVNDQCVSRHAGAARQRGFDVPMPLGCIADSNRRALEHLRDDPSGMTSSARTVKLKAGAKS